MSRKTTIRSTADGRWTVTRPAFGFSLTDTTEHTVDTWEQAWDSVARHIAAAPSQITPAARPARPRGYLRTTNTPLEIT